MSSAFTSWLTGAFDLTYPKYYLFVTDSNNKAYSYRGQIQEFWIREEEGGGGGPNFDSDVYTVVFCGKFLIGGWVTG